MFRAAFTVSILTQPKGWMQLTVLLRYIERHLRIVSGGNWACQGIRNGADALLG